MADLSARAQAADRDDDTASASAVFNLTALLASDIGLPDLARQWCHHQANVYLRAHPLGAQAARNALEPLVNLSRLHTRAGQGERAFALLDTLYTAVSTRTDTVIDGIEVPAARLTASLEDHKEVRRWLWATLLSTGARALAVAGRWQEALDRLRAYKGVGVRMLDGRQVAVISHAVNGDTPAALALIADTQRGEPWENAVTACLTILCGDAASQDLNGLLHDYKALDSTAPGLAVFHGRLGLSMIDALGGIDAHAHRIAMELIDRTAASGDGYAARDLLAHTGCADLLTESQRHQLATSVKACALDHGAIPVRLHGDVTAALARAETVLVRNLSDDQA